RFADDPWSKELRDAIIQDRKNLPAATIVVQDRPANYPAFALRTAGGGAIVIYVTRRDFVGTAQDRLWQLKGVFAALARTQAASKRLKVSWLYQWAAFLPPSTSGKVQVIGRYGGVLSVSQ